MNGCWSAAAIAALFAAAWSGAGCDYDEKVPPSAVSDGAVGEGGRPSEPGAACATEAGVREVFARHCTACHDADRPSAGLDLETPGLLGRLAGRGSVHMSCRDVPLVVPGHPEEGLLMPKLFGTLIDCGDPMPPTGALAPGELQCIARWIAASESPPPPPR